MSYQLLIVRSGSVSPLITVILADVNQPTRKNFVLHRDAFHVPGEEGDITATLYVSTRGKKYGIIAAADK